MKLKMSSGGRDLRQKFMALQDVARGRVLGEATLAAGKVIRDRAREIAGEHRITGKLEKNIVMELHPTGEMSAEVHIGFSESGFYGAFLEDGVTIEPKKAPFLVFKVDDRWVRTKGPIHVPAYPMIRPAADEKRRAALYVFRNYLKDAIREAL